MLFFVVVLLFGVVVLMLLFWCCCDVVVVILFFLFWLKLGVSSRGPVGGSSRESFHRSSDPKELVEEWNILTDFECLIDMLKEVIKKLFVYCPFRSFQPSINKSLHKSKIRFFEHSVFTFSHTLVSNF